MNDQVYVFIDESGNHAQQGCYVIAGCWCTPSYTDPKSILQSTRNRLSDNLLYDETGPSPGRELKGTRSDTAKLDSAFTYFRKVVQRDETIRTSETFWDADRPVRFTTFAIDSELSEKITRRYLGEGRTSTTTQIVGLVSVLTPLIQLGTNDQCVTPKAHVILDADTWKRASTIVGNMIDAHEGAPETSFETRDSTAIPGIQLSDIAAYAQRLRLVEGDCRIATNVLSSLEM